MRELPSMLRQFWYTNLNTVLYSLRRGQYLWLEGRFRRGRFHNWSHEFRFRPSNFVRPSSEAEIAEQIRQHDKVRVTGGGHSFNAGLVTDQVLLSLDLFAGIISIDREKMEARVRGGTRIRDISHALWKEGLALIALPSHDGQSIAGLLSTDTHGTGREQGFVSQSVRRMKVVDGHGDVIECGPDDDLFQAAIGGFGAVGVIVEVVLQVVPRFNIEHKTWMVDLDEALENLDHYQSSHDHFSLYMFPFAKRCQINTWDRTDKKLSFLGPFRQYVSWSIEAFLATTAANAVVWFRLLPRLANIMSRMRLNTDLVLESYKGFHLSIYYVSQSMEFAFPQEKTREVWEQLNKLYESTFLASTTPFLFMDVRFTPAGHHGTFIGPGRERASTWIDLLASPTTGYEELYAAAEEILRKIDARIHLGKYTGTFDAKDLARLHKDHYDKFVETVERHDPHGKFQTLFSQRFLPARS